MSCVQTKKGAPIDWDFVCFVIERSSFFLYLDLVFQHCGPSEPSSPLLLMDRLSFEMHKTYTETRLQLHLTPATIVLADGIEVMKNS